MTPKDKAEDMFVKILEYIPDYIVPDNGDASGIAKVSALICCDEIINCIEASDIPFPKSKLQHTEYWQFVKSEIEKI